MKYTLIFLLIILTSCHTQKKITDVSLPTEQNFKDQGEQEDYWAKKLFAQQYSSETYKHYQGVINVVNDTLIKYDNTYVRIYHCPIEIKPVFEKGIIYPDLFQNGDLVISNVTEEKFLSNSPQIKRFKIWVLAPKLSNPLVYFFELTNKRATNDTTMANFINGCKLTFVKQGWVVI